MDVIGGICQIILSIGALVGMWWFFAWLGNKQEEVSDRRFRREIAKCEEERKAKKVETEKKARWEEFDRKIQEAETRKMAERNERMKMYKKEYDEYIRGMNNTGYPSQFRLLTFDQWKEIFNKK